MDATLNSVTATITSNDSDNIITSGQVTLTATFSANMNAAPTISISGVAISMTQSTTAAVWTTTGKYLQISRVLQLM